MNERIKELAEQAGMAINLDTDFYEKDTNKWVDYFSEKFAELIIKECIAVCSNHTDVESFGIYPIRVAMVTEACRNNIKEYFGVNLD